MKGGVQEDSDVNAERAVRDDGLEGNEKGRHKSSKSRKSGSGEETDGWDDNGRRRNSGDRSDGRRSSGGSTRGYLDENDQDARKEQRSKHVKKNQEESTLEKLSNWYQDGESKNRHDSGDKPGSRDQGCADDSDRNLRKTTLNSSEYKGSQSKGRSKDEKHQELDHDKAADKDARSLEQREGSRDKGQGSSDRGKFFKRRWDESDVAKKIEGSSYAEKSEPKSGDGSDSKHDDTRERITSVRVELSDGKVMGSEHGGEKGKSYSRDNRRVDPERTKSRGWSDAAGEDNKASPLTRDDRSSGERNEKHREQKTTSRVKSLTQEEHGDVTKEKNDKYREQKTTRYDPSETREKSFNIQEDGILSTMENNDKYRNQNTNSHTYEKIEKSFYPEEDVNTWTVEKSEKHIKQRRTNNTPAENLDKSFDLEDSVDYWTREKNEKYVEQKIYTLDPAENREKSSIQEEEEEEEEEGNPSAWDGKGRQGGYFRRSRTPERSVRIPESENFEVDYERSSSLKQKEMEIDGYRDERIQNRDDIWSDRNRDREGSRESWKRRQTFNNDKDGDMVYDRDRDWDFPRRGRDRMDNERLIGRSGNRRDGRSEAVKASSSIDISTENYDFIEIPTNYARRNQGQIIDTKSASQDEWATPQDDRSRAGTFGYAAPSEASKERQLENGAVLQDNNAWRDDADSQGQRTRRQKEVGLSSGGQSSSSVSHSPYGNDEPGSFGRMGQQGAKGGRIGRGSRVRPAGRDNQPVNVPVPLMGSPFGPMGMLPSALNPPMSPAPGPVLPGGFFPGFSPPVVWPGPRGVEMNMFPGVPPVSPGPPGQRFPPNMGIPPNPAMFFNQPGPGRGMPPSGAGPGFNPVVTVGHGQLNDKASGAWIPPKSGGPPGRAPSRGEQNDYSQNFVDTGMRPQNFIRELELTNVEDYPKLRDLIQKKDEIVANSASAPMYYKCDLREFILSPESFGTKFDVILIDPPWEEYVHRAPGCTDNMEYWTFEEIMNLKIEAIADTPSFIFLWVGDGLGLEQGRQCLKKWGFRRCEDICWVKTNKNTATPSLRHDSHTLFQHSKEHCLMGIKGTVRRSTDGHIIHANIDTDVVIAEEPPYGSTAKPDDIYRIIEHFSLGRRRIELFGEDHNIRAGWFTVGKGLSSSNFNAEAYVRNFADKDGKVWQGGGGRNPPPDAPHLVQTTPEIEALRPKSPMKNQQQLQLQQQQQQQQSTSITLTTATSGNKRPAGNSPQAPPNAFGLNQEVPGNPFGPWAPMMEAHNGRDFGAMGPSDHIFDMYGYGGAPPPMLQSGEYLDFDSQSPMSMPVSRNG